MGRDILGALAQQAGQLLHCGISPGCLSDVRLIGLHFALMWVTTSPASYMGVAEWPAIAACYDATGVGRQ